MKANMLLAAFLSIAVSRLAYADTEINVMNTIAPGKNVAVQVCVDNGICTDWLDSSDLWYNSRNITKSGVVDQGFLMISYRNGRGHAIQRYLRLPADADQYSNQVITLRVLDENGAVSVRMNGKDYLLNAHSEDV